MTIWEAYDRRGLHWFTARPTYNAGHDIFQGIACPQPKKGDRVVRNYTAPVAVPDVMAKYYPKVLKVGTPRKRKKRKVSR